MGTPPRPHHAAVKLPVLTRPLRPLRWSAAFAVLGLGVGIAVAVSAPATLPSPSAKPASAAATAPTVVPPAPASAAEVEPAAELSFGEFFHLPVGPRGVEFSEKLTRLHGQRVRITGHMVNHLHADPRVFILSSVPLKFHQCEYGLCDDLPATAVHVHVPGNPRDRVAFTPGELVLTGRLSVGNAEELDGRISAVRLFLDPAKASAMRTVAAAAGTVR